MYCREVYFSLLEYHLAAYERLTLTGSRVSVVSALDFQSLILSLIPGGIPALSLSIMPESPINILYNDFMFFRLYVHT